MIFCRLAQLQPPTQEPETMRMPYDFLLFLWRTRRAHGRSSRPCKMQNMGHIWCTLPDWIGSVLAGGPRTVVASPMAAFVQREDVDSLNVGALNAPCDFQITLRASVSFFHKFVLGARTLCSIAGALDWAARPRPQPLASWAHRQGFGWDA